MLKHFQCISFININITVTVMIPPYCVTLEKPFSINWSKEYKVSLTDVLKICMLVNLYWIFPRCQIWIILSSPSTGEQTKGRKAKLTCCMLHTDKLGYSWDWAACLASDFMLGTMLLLCNEVSDSADVSNTVHLRCQVSTWPSMELLETHQAWYLLSPTGKLKGKCSRNFGRQVITVSQFLQTTRKQSNNLLYNTL